MGRLGFRTKRTVNRAVALRVMTLPVALMAGLLQARPAVAQDQQVQVIELTAKKYEYSPAPIHVKAGTKVQLKITAVDHDHGFKVTTEAKGDSKPGLVFTSAQDCWQLKKGTTTTIEFVAETPGTYAFKCCHVCGMGHGGMHSEIIVE